MNSNLFKKITRGIKHGVIIRERFAKGKYVKVRIVGIYLVVNFKKPYQILISMICRLYVIKDVIFFKESWLPLVQYITTRGIIFNLASNFNSTLIKQSKEYKSLT